MEDKRLYLEPEREGLERRVFRYENTLQGAFIEWCYYAELQNCPRPRWYGFASRVMPEGCEII